METGALELLTNGHMTYACLLGESFYWKQPPEEIARRPRLWPLAVIEYPLSFLKLYRDVAALSELKTPFHFRLEYRNILGHFLPPGPPTDFGFLRGHQAVPYPQDNLQLYETVPPDFKPDHVTYDLMRDIYAAFGYGADAIPFWEAQRGHFEFPGR